MPEPRAKRRRRPNFRGGMGLDWAAVLWGGFIATVAALFAFGALRAYGWLRYSPTILAGAVLIPHPERPHTDALGIALTVLAGTTVIPSLYALLMEGVGWVGTLAGSLLGLVHGTAVLALLPVYGRVSRGVRDQVIAPPGKFGRGWGWRSGAGLVAGHVLYGAVFGVILGAF